MNKNAEVLAVCHESRSGILLARADTAKFLMYFTRKRWLNFRRQALKVAHSFGNSPISPPR